MTDPRQRLFEAWRDADVALCSFSASLHSAKGSVQNEGIARDVIAEDLRCALGQADALWRHARRATVLARRTAAFLGVTIPRVATEAPLVVMVTGHRPPKVDDAFTETQQWIRAELSSWLRKLEAQRRDQGVIALTGMALGVDQWFAEEALALGIPVWAAVPFVGQDARWTLEKQIAYKRILGQCWRVNVVSAQAPAEGARPLLKTVCVATGPEGMIGGQALDLLFEGKRVPLQKIYAMHRRKTGALLRGSVRLGAQIGGATAARLRAFDAFGSRIGLAFQIVDDLLNVRSTRREMGKSVGSDRAKGKATAPARAGSERAERDAARLLQGAAGLSGRLGKRAAEFESLTHYLLNRTH